MTAITSWPVRNSRTRTGDLTSLARTLRFGADAQAVEAVLATHAAIAHGG
jgi:hypothetical protein